MGEKNFNLWQILGFSSLGLTIGFVAGVVSSINMLDILNDFFSDSNKFHNIEKWNNLVFNVSLTNFYITNIYKFDELELRSINENLQEGYEKIGELKNNHIKFINDFVYNSNFNSYNKQLFEFETNVYFEKLSFLFTDYTLNNTVVSSNFNTSSAESNDNLKYFLSEYEKPYSLSYEYRKKLNDVMRIINYIKPFNE